MNDGLGKRVVLGIKWTAIYKLTGQIINWLSTLWVVRLLSPDDYGLNAMLEAPLDFAMIFATWGLYTALIKQQVMEAQELSAIFGFMLLINVVAFAAFQLLATDIASYFRDPRLAQLVQAIAVVFLLVPFRIIPNALLDQQLQFKLRAQVDLVASLLGAIAAVLMAMAGAGVWALLASVLVNYLVRAVVLSVMHPWFVRPSFQLSHAKGTIALGAKVLGSGVLIIFTAKSIEVIAGPVVGAQTLGIFAVAAQLSMIPLSRILPIVNQTLYPAFVHIQNDAERVRQYSIRSIQYTALLVVPSAIGLHLTADLIIDVLFGVRWEELKSVFPVLCLLLPVAMVRNLIGANLVALGKANQQLALNAAVLGISVVLCFALRVHGLQGLVWIYVGTTVLATALVYAICHGFLKITAGDLAGALMPALVCAFIMGLVVALLRMLSTQVDDLALLGVLITAGTISYVVALRGLYPVLFHEMVSAIKANE